MGNDYASSADYLKQLQNTVMQDSWLEGLYGKNRVDQQSELKKIFNVIADNNVSTAEKKSLEARKETLAEKVERLEAKMAVLQEQMAALEDEISKKANEITDLVSQAEGKSRALEEDQRKYVKEAIDDVFYMYNNGIIGKDAIMPEIRTRIVNENMKSSDAREIEKILGKLDAKQGEVAGLVNDTTKLIDQKKLLNSQYGATKSTYDFIKANLNKIGATETNYTNTDTTSGIPVYSLEKTSIVTNMFENQKYNVEPGENKNYKEGTTEPPKIDLSEKYGKYLGTAATPGADKNSNLNKAVQNLGKAINLGLLDDIKASGMSGSDVIKFFTENFAGANIKLSKNGTLSIPFGHGDAAKGIFNKLTNFINNYDSAFRGPLNTWDKNQGNTIDSNKQIASLSDNYTDILNKLGKQEPKFTFKEAMFALFNSETGLFKNSGVNYDLSKQDGTPNYSIDPAGDEKTAKMYKGLADKIYEIWGIKPSNSNINAENSEDDGGTPGTPTPSPSKPIKRTDPLSFKGADGTEFAFYVDKDENGKFDNANEFVGGTGDWIGDLKALDENGDGKLSGDELKKLKMIGTKYEDNAKTKYESNKYLRSETTNVQYSWTNAEEMGISEIDLNALGEANKSTGKYDINGSEIFEDSFSFKIGDKEYTAERKDETNLFMNTIYGDAYGRSEKIGLNEEEADEIINRDYGEYDQFANNLSKVEGDFNILKNADQIANNARQAFNDTMDRIDDNEKAQLLRASNKSAALNSDGSWGEMMREIQQIAAKEGIAIDYEQAKGIYMSNIDLSARDVVNRYSAQIANERNIEASRTIDKEIWKAIVLGARNGVNAAPDAVRKLILEGKAKNAEEAVQYILDNTPVKDEVVVGKLDFNSEREKELVSAFQKVFSEAGLGSDAAVKALYDLVVKSQENRGYTAGKSGESLAKEMLKNYQR